MSKSVKHSYVRILVKLTPEDGETTDAVSQEFDKGEKNYDEVKDVPTVLEKQDFFQWVVHK